MGVEHLILRIKWLISCLRKMANSSSMAFKTKKFEQWHMPIINKKKACCEGKGIAKKFDWKCFIYNKTRHQANDSR